MVYKNLLLLSCFALCIITSPAISFSNSLDSRTASRSVGSSDVLIVPNHLFPDRNTESHPENTSLSPLFEKYRHSQQWDGMQWDPKAWKSEKWSKTSTLGIFHTRDIFRRQYMRKNRPAVEIGPNFYMLSALDQTRSLKLLSDYFDFFSSGYPSFEVRDWRTDKKIGDYTKLGLNLK